jgi:hypothetical protein
MGNGSQLAKEILVMPKGWDPSVLKKRPPAKGNSPDAGTDEEDANLVAQVHQALNEGDSVMSNLGFGASVADLALKHGSSKVGAIAGGLGKANAVMSVVRAGVDAGRLLTDKDHWEKTQAEGADGSLSGVEFGLSAIDPGQLPTTVVRATGMVGGVMDANRAAGEALAMKEHQDKLFGLHQKKKAKHPLTYGQGGEGDVPVVDPDRARQIAAAKAAFEDENLESMTMQLVRNVTRQGR